MDLLNFDDADIDDEEEKKEGNDFPEELFSDMSGIQQPNMSNNQ